MSIEDNIKLVKDTMDAVMRVGPEPLLAASTDDVVIKAIIADGTPISGHFQGKEGILRYFGALGEVMEILEVTSTDYTGSESSVVILGTERARVKRTGKMLDCEIATVFTLEGGKIKRIVAMAEMSPIVDAYRESAR